MRRRPLRFGSGAASAMSSKSSRARDFPRLPDGMGERIGGVFSHRLPNRRFVAASDPSVIREVLATKRKTSTKRSATKIRGTMNDPTIATADGDDPAPPAIDSRGVHRVEGELPLRVRERRRG